MPKRIIKSAVPRQTIKVTLLESETPELFAKLATMEKTARAGFLRNAAYAWLTRSNTAADPPAPVQSTSYGARLSRPPPAADSLVGMDTAPRARADDHASPEVSVPQAVIVGLSGSIRGFDGKL